MIQVVSPEEVFKIGLSLSSYRATLLQNVRSIMRVTNLVPALAAAELKLEVSFTQWNFLSLSVVETDKHLFAARKRKV